MTAKPSFLRPRAWLLAAASVAALGSAVAQTADPIKPAQIAPIPLYSDIAGDRPTMLLAPSVEFPTVGLLHNYGGSESDTYSPSEEYLGYFNHEMCYEYNKEGGYFEISQKASSRKCSGDKEFSGNYLNWVSASAIDMMRLALTGGDRVIDEPGLTVLQRAYIPDGTASVTSVTLSDGTVKSDEKGNLNKSPRGPQCYWKHSSYFYTKVLNKSDGGGNYAGAVPKKMIEAAEVQGASTVYAANIGNRIHFGVHEMGGISGNDIGSSDPYLYCTYGPYNYVLGAGGEVNEFHSVRKNAFTGNASGTKKHTTCSHGVKCDAGSKPRRIWYGSNKTGQRWITGIVKGQYTCGTFDAVDNTHGDTAELKQTDENYDTARKCYLEDGDANLSGDTPFFYARVKVCDNKDVRDYLDSKGADFGYCREYPSGHKKPVGVIQKYADDLRVGIFGYAIDQTAAHDTDSYKGRFGGVLRAPMKYVGHNTYSSTGVKTSGNDRAEWDEDTGVLVENPEGDTEFGVSGVINYFNRFGRNPNKLGNYKQFDNVGELYYEALRYMQGLPPTPAAVSNLDDAMKDGFPAYTSWDGLDPFDSSKGYTNTADYTCLNNSLLIIGDIYTHDAVNSSHGKEQLRGTMEGENADASKNEIDLLHWRDVVRAFETGGSKDYKDGQDKERTTETPSGETTFPSGMTGVSEKTRNIWSLIPGMAYWAHTHDIRGENWKDEKDAKKVNSKARPGLRLTSYFFDVNENGWSTRYDYRKGTVNQHGGTEWPKDGNYHWGNQFWLGAKYGGFKTQPNGEDDKDYSATGNPFYQSTCTEDDDGNETCINGAASNAVWSDLKKAQGDNTNGKANPEPRTYFMPSNARGVIAAFDEIFGAVKPPANRSIGGADSTGGLSGASFQATFNGEDWSGDVVSENVRDQTQIWSASEQLGKGEPRNIISATHGDDGSTTAFDFTTGGTPSEVQELLDGDGATAAERIGWLRGDDRSKEGGTLRARSSLLGDIINSGVKYVGAPSGTVNLGDAFDAYVEAQANRQSVVYVGANDGMLHAFSADTGSELFAYIPSWMHDKLAALTDPKYSHQAYVDATPVIGDAKLGSATGTNAQASDWHTVLVGGTGGGGKGVYAIDVTNPTAFTKNNVLWEFTDADDPDMGYVLGQSRIVKLLTAKADANVAGSVDTYRWFAMVPAGVNNYVGDDATKRGNGDANIFLLALDKAPNQLWAKGSNYWKIQLPRIDALAATYPTGVLNLEAFTGVGGVTEYVYAGDLHGQLWALKFKGYETSDWNAATLAAPYVSGSKAVPLFVAKNANGDPQPITAAPTILEGAGNGIHFVSFGTGKYFEQSDARTTYINTFYTVYSNFTHTSASDIAGFGGVGAAVIPSRDHLQKVEQTEEDAATETTYFGPQSQFYWGWTATPTGSEAPRVRSGWYYDFAGDGEREVADATWISLTSRLMFSTLTPNSATETGVCGTGGGDSKLYTFDMVSGKGFRKSSTVGMLSQPLVFLDTEEATETEADSTGRRLRITPVFSGQFGSKGASTNQVDTVIVPFGRLSWRRIDNFQELYHEGKPSTATTGGNQ